MTAILSVGAATVSVVLPLTAPSVALIGGRADGDPVGEPGGADRGRGGVADAQVTDAVRSAVEASEYVPVALNCWSVPARIVGLAGVTAMLVRSGRRSEVRTRRAARARVDVDDAVGHRRG